MLSEDIKSVTLVKFLSKTKEEVEDFARRIAGASSSSPYFLPVSLEFVACVLIYSNS